MNTRYFNIQELMTSHSFCNDVVLNGRNTAIKNAQNIIKRQIKRNALIRS